MLGVALSNPLIILGLVLAFNGLPAVRAMSPATGNTVETAVTIVLLGVLVSQIFGPIIIDYAIRRGSAELARA
jgi:hypothetical protein